MKSTGGFTNGSAGRARYVFAFGCATAAALGSGMVLGLVAGKNDLGLSALALPVGFLPGLILRLVGIPRRAAILVLSVLCVLPGLGLYGWVCSSRAPQWTAEERIVDDAKLDELVWSIKVVQLVNERQVEVWDYEQAPEGLKKDARRIVAGMTRAEKLALCDEKYGRRINEGPVPRSFTERYVAPVTWISLTLLCAVGALAVGNQNRGGE